MWETRVILLNADGWAGPEPSCGHSPMFGGTGLSLLGPSVSAELEQGEDLGADETCKEDLFLALIRVCVCVCAHMQSCAQLSYSYIQALNPS